MLINLFFIAFFLSLNFQAQVVVGEGTVVNEEMPIEPFYKFSYSQVIYTSNEINASGSITGLKYSANDGTFSKFRLNTHGSAERSELKKFSHGKFNSLTCN